MDIVKSKKEIKRVKTYIDGLDENLEGGIPEGHIVIINGASGTMKSSISFNVLYNKVINGSTVLYATLEQSSASIIKHMVNMDFDMSKINLHIISDMSKIEKDLKSIKSSKKSDQSGWLDAIKNLVTRVTGATDCKILVLDSLSALYALSEFKEPRKELFYIFEFLRTFNLTSFLISETSFDKNDIAQFSVEESLADGIIRLKLTERYRKVTRELSIAKMRATNCNLDIFTLEYKNKRFYALYGGKTPVI